MSLYFEAGYENNFQSHTYKANLDVSGYLVAGDNTMSVEVTNKGVAGSNSLNNPAAVRYKLNLKLPSETSCMRTTLPVQPVPETTVIDGYKYVRDGVVEVPKAGWMIYAYNSGTEESLATTTDQEGYYFFEVSEGEWEISEEAPRNWKQVAVYQNEAVLTGDGLSAVTCIFTIDSSVAQSGVSCSFINEFEGEIEIPVVPPTTPPPVIDSFSRNSSSNTTGTRVTTRVLFAPLVAGIATTTNPIVCPFLTDYMQMGSQNDALEVTKLQLFLQIFKDMFGGAPNPITGVFDGTTEANVKAFQLMYKAEILDPWFTLGIVPHDRPTGFVYKTTLWKINSIICPDYAITPDFAGEDLTQNIKI